MIIKKIKAIRVFDSRGIPTLKTFVWAGNSVGSASVPSGTSTGKNEACELRDKDKEYLGYDIKSAINNVNGVIAKRLKGFIVEDQKKIDDAMISLDGTPGKSRLGANAILSVSLACARTAAEAKGKQLYEHISSLASKKSSPKKSAMPIPLLNIINGGSHAGSRLTFQEFQIIPKQKDFENRMQASSEIYLTLKDILSRNFGKSAINVGYEGGFVPPIFKAEDAFAVMQEAIDKTGYSKDVFLGIDCAASGVYDPRGRYLVDGKVISPDRLMEYYFNLINNYKVTSIEDPFADTDKQSWEKFNGIINPKKTMLIGDDLLATNPLLIKQAIKEKYCNSLLLKLNQIGTLTEAIDAFNLAKKAGWKVVVSHRSGETEDSFIADLAYGLGAEYIKFGAPARGERTAKYNRLLEIDYFK